ncbi:MAG TPA: PQQ-binding-like beta-propeller repeat protein [Verrucomicrobiales bacterium]|nr:PQQ-binding-like beta-propeller repeat protein [Verrucomicrobiales bacterium]
MKSLFTAIALAGSVLHAPAAEEIWNQFRGPKADGHSTATNLPTEWDDTKNVKWKTPIPNKGWSTPLVSATQVWLTAATPTGHDYFVYCLDRATGEIKHQAKLFHSDKPEPLGNDLNSYASPTGVLNEGRVYVHFGSYGTACIDTNTFKEVWRRTDLPCRHYRGPGSSLFDWKDTIILTMDGVDVQYLCALDKKTGKDVWKTPRSTAYGDEGPDGKPAAEGDYRKAYTTPALITVDGKPQIVSSGSKAAFGYDPDTGKELWHTTYKGFSNAAIAAWSNGVVAINTGHGKANLQAFPIAADTVGDITAKRIWEQTKAIPTRSSPVAVDGVIYLNGDSGILSAVDFKDGALLFNERTQGNASASPLYADGKLFFCNEHGVTTILKPGRTFEKIAANKLPDGIMASPVALGKELFIRTKTALYCISQ